MAVDGNWKITVQTPMGPRDSQLSFSTKDGKLTGTQTASTGASREISEGTVNGNAVAWKTAINQPMPMTLEFSGTVDGDTITGSVKLGNFGNATFSGARA